MGRMKVYGGSWDLPEAPPQHNPFKDCLVTEAAEPVRSAEFDRAEVVDGTDVSEFLDVSVPKEDQNLTP